MTALLARCEAMRPEFPGAWFNADLAERCIAFFPRYLCLTDDKWAGKPFILGEWQAEIVARLFGWQRASGGRVYRRLGLWVPRKNGKTEFAAGIAHLAMLVDGLSGGQGYSIGSNVDQASIVFKKMAAMASYSEAMKRETTAFTKSLIYPRLSSTFKPMTGKPDGKHGYGMSVLIGDEVHEWKDDRLYQFLHQSSAHRSQPIEILISTAGLKQGFGWEFYNHCEQVLSGHRSDPELLVVIFAADPDEDWTAEAAWRKANPNFGISVRPDYLAAECLKARENARLENDFKRYHLNLWTEQAVRWLPVTTWDENSAEPPASPLEWGRVADRIREAEKELVGLPCVGALDVGVIHDLAAFVLAFKRPDGVTVLLPRFWVPRATAERRQRVDKVPYVEWIKHGLIIETGGLVTDFDRMLQDILEDFSRFDVSKVGFDAWNSESFRAKMTDAGIPIQPIRQGFRTMSPFSKDFERAFVQRKIEHFRHPVLRWMVGNAAVETDAAGNIKPAKNRSTDRIDGLVASIMAFGQANSSEAQPASPWDDPNFRISA